MDTQQHILVSYRAFLASQSLTVFFVGPVVQLQLYNRAHPLSNWRTTMHKVKKPPPKKK